MKRWTIYDEDVKSGLQLMRSLGNKINEVIDKFNNKTDLRGDHKGSWHGVRRPTLVSEATGTILDRLHKSVQVNIWEYQDLVNEDNDWSSAIEQLLLENQKGEVYIPQGEYNFSRPILLGESNSLKLDVGAIIKPTAYMEVFIRRHGTKDNLTREYNFYNRIYGGGVIDCNSLANIGISLGGYRHYKVYDLTILNFLEVGLVTKGNGVNYAVECVGNNLYFEIGNNNTNINATGLKVNSTDNHFTDIFCIDCEIGVDVSGASNRFTRCHIWNRDRIIEKDLGYIGFNVSSVDNTFDTCYADTVNIGFKTVHSNTYINCNGFNSQFFKASNSKFFVIDGTPSHPLFLINCRCKGDNASAIFVKAIEGTVNTFVHLISCSTGFNVTEGFPNNPSFGAEHYWGGKMDLRGDINAENITVRTNTNLKTVYASDKVQVPKLELGSLGKKVTMNDDYILMNNDRPIPVYHNYKPENSLSPGVIGQMYLDITGLYIYSGDTDGWLLIDRSVLKTF